MWMTSSDNYKLHTSLMIIDFLLAEIVTANASMSGFAKKHPHAQRDSPRCNVRKRPLGGCWPVAPAVPPVSAKVCQNFRLLHLVFLHWPYRSKSPPLPPGLLKIQTCNLLKRFTPARIRTFQDLA